MSVIDFAARKAEREPHSSGIRICLGCRYEWVGIAPMGVNLSLECPECGLPKGVTKNLYGSEEGTAAFFCSCGCEVMFAYVTKAGDVQIRCLACGERHNEALFD